LPRGQVEDGRARLGETDFARNHNGVKLAEQVKLMEERTQPLIPV